MKQVSRKDARAQRKDRIFASRAAGLFASSGERLFLIMSKAKQIPVSGTHSERSNKAGRTQRRKGAKIRKTYCELVIRDLRGFAPLRENLFVSAPLANMESIKQTELST